MFVFFPRCLAAARVTTEVRIDLGGKFVIENRDRDAGEKIPSMCFPKLFVWFNCVQGAVCARFDSLFIPYPPIIALPS